MSMRYSLPVGQYVSEILGFPGLYGIVQELERQIAKEFGLIVEPENEYVISKEDYEQLKRELERILNCEFEGDIVYFDKWERYPKAILIHSLLESEFADKIRAHYETISQLKEEGFEVFAETDKRGIVQVGSTYFRYRIAEKEDIELFRDLDEQLSILAFETVINWFIREFVKKHFDNKCVLKSVRILDIKTTPKEVESVEEIDELHLRFVALIEVNGKSREYEVETINWVEKSLKENLDTIL